MRLLYLVFAAAVFTGSAFAAEDSAVKYRKLVMKSLGGHMGATASIVKGEAGATHHLVAHAATMASIAKMAGDLFPKGSDKGNTRALPVIWEQPQEFAKTVQALEAATGELVAAARSGEGNEIKNAFAAVGKSCGGCHKKFRKKKKKK